jgi:hypothetical protein
MANEYLATYLNDHLAGSVVALELLEHLAEAYPDTPAARVLTELRADIAADQQELKALMDRLQVTESLPRKAASWLAEKLSELKLRLDDLSGGPLRLLEGLDALAAGIEGKRALWWALSAATSVAPELQGPDYVHLAERAEEQQGRVEVVRLESAKAAFKAAP